MKVNPTKHLSLRRLLALCLALPLAAVAFTATSGTAMASGHCAPAGRGVHICVNVTSPYSQYPRYISRIDASIKLPYGLGPQWPDWMTYEYPKDHIHIWGPHGSWHLDLYYDGFTWDPNTDGDVGLLSVGHNFFANTPPGEVCAAYSGMTENNSKYDGPDNNAITCVKVTGAAKPSSTPGPNPKPTTQHPSSYSCDPKPGYYCLMGTGTPVKKPTTKKPTTTRKTTTKKSTGTKKSTSKPKTVCSTKTSGATTVRTCRSSTETVVTTTTRSSTATTVRTCTTVRGRKTKCSTKTTKKATTPPSSPAPTPAPAPAPAAPAAPAPVTKTLTASPASCTVGAAKLQATANVTYYWNSSGLTWQTNGSEVAYNPANAATSVKWNSITLNGTKGVGARVDMMVSGKEVAHWSGGVTPQTWNLNPVEPIGSKLWIEGEFGSSTHCGITITS